MADQASNTGGWGSKGKGKAVDPQGDTEMHDDAMDLDEDDEDDEDFDEDEDDAEQGADDDEDEDDMAEIDLDNIVDTGRRTRGKVIDFAKAAAETKNEPFPGADEDEDEDDDYEIPSEGVKH